MWETDFYLNRNKLFRFIIMLVFCSGIRFGYEVSNPDSYLKVCLKQTLTCDGSPGRKSGPRKVSALSTSGDLVFCLQGSNGSLDGYLFWQINASVNKSLLVPTQHDWEADD